jgi:SAM-dependent methyltransferase
MTGAIVAEAGPLPETRVAALDYAGKPDTYFAGARRDFVKRLPTDPDARILEIGCGSGDTAALAIADGKAGYYAGVELFPAAADAARNIMNEVVVGDVERVALPWPAESFDAAILSEVLEHLQDPWSVVRRVAGLLRPGGLVLASSPNIAHWRMLAEIARGRFDLADSGPFDRTHLRWFTPSTFARMFEEAGFEIEHIGPVTPFAARTRALCWLAGGRLDHLFMRQIAVVASRRA